MAEQIELMMRQVKLGGMAKGWRSVRYENTEQYVTELLKLELQEREANRINRMVKTAGFRVLKTLDEFVWNSAIELPSGLTQEYMTDRSRNKFVMRALFINAVCHTDTVYVQRIFFNEGDSRCTGYL